MRAQEVSAQLDTDDGVEADVDPHRMHQVVGNLVANALAHMRDGGRLDASVVGTTITIADTGPGIPEADMEGLFDRFAKASDSAGSGLGLSIARDLVEAHGGTITATNRPEGGAMFEVRLPTP